MNGKIKKPTINSLRPTNCRVHHYIFTGVMRKILMTFRGPSSKNCPLDPKQTMRWLDFGFTLATSSYCSSASFIASFLYLCKVKGHIENALSGKSTSYVCQNLLQSDWKTLWIVCLDLADKFWEDNYIASQYTRNLHHIILGKHLERKCFTGLEFEIFQLLNYNLGIDDADILDLLPGADSNDQLFVNTNCLASAYVSDYVKTRCTDNNFIFKDRRELVPQDKNCCRDDVYEPIEFCFYDAFYQKIGNNRAATPVKSSMHVMPQHRMSMANIPTNITVSKPRYSTPVRNANKHLRSQSVLDPAHLRPAMTPFGRSSCGSVPPKRVPILHNRQENSKQDVNVNINEPHKFAQNIPPVPHHMPLIMIPPQPNRPVAHHNIVLPLNNVQGGPFPVLMKSWASSDMPSGQQPQYSRIFPSGEIAMPRGNISIESTPGNHQLMIGPKQSSESNCLSTPTHRQHLTAPDISKNPLLQPGVSPRQIAPRFISQPKYPAQITYVQHAPSHEPVFIHERRRTAPVVQYVPLNNCRKIV